MAIQITVPRLGWSMDEGTLTEWLKREGEFVRKGDMLFVLEGDKAAQEIECFDEGFLKFLPDGPQPGDSVRVGQLLAYLIAEDEELPPADSPTGSEPLTHAKPTSTSDAAPLPQNPIARNPVNETAAHASPRARRRAAETGVDWTRIPGSGRSGRVRERDVLAAAGLQSDTAVQSGSTGSHDLLEHTQVRRTIADRMLRSHQSTAPVTLTAIADATRLVELRKEFQTAAKSSEAVVPSFTDFIAKLTAAALRDHPTLNSRWDERGIVRFKQIHIGIAVDTDAGLIVPVVRDVSQLTIVELAARTRELIARARSRRLTAEEMQGGTFTITNLGAYGIDAFTPIIQSPQCAILGIGRIHQAAVFQDNQFVPRDKVTLSLTFDHRIIDGAPAARFLQAVCKALENPDEKVG